MTTPQESLSKQSTTDAFFSPGRARKTAKAPVVEGLLLLGKHYASNVSAAGLPKPWAVSLDRSGVMFWGRG